MSVKPKNLSVAMYKRRKEKPRCDIVVEDRPIREPGDDDVILKMHSVGICGSDVHVWLDGAVAEFEMTDKPMVSGHEASGTVFKCGKNVTNLKPGDRVAVEPGVPLETDEFTKSGRYNLCNRMFFCSAPPKDDGALQQYYTHNAEYCYKLPDSVSYEEGALIEPLSVGIHACRQGNISLGQKVLILGSGPIGLMCLIVAKAMGASAVAMADISESRLTKAREVGAHITYQVDKTSTPEDDAKKIEQILGGMPDCTMECTGSESAITTGMFATKAGGCLVLVGIGQKYAMTPLIHATLREVDIRGVLRYRNTWPTAINMLASGQINVKPLVTNRFPIERAQEAFEYARDGKGIKVMLKCNADEQHLH